MDGINFSTLPWRIFILILLFLITTTKVPKSDSQRPQLVHTWDGGMEEEWFLQGGELCNALADSADHFSDFYRLTIGPDGLKVGVSVAAAQELARQRCGKARVRILTCIDRTCNCRDSTQFFDGVKCAKFDGQRCVQGGPEPPKRDQECISGYICDRLVNQPTLVQTAQSSVLRNQIQVENRTLVAIEESMAKVGQEHRRRQYAFRLVDESAAVFRVIGEVLRLLTAAGRELGRNLTIRDADQNMPSDAKYFDWRDNNLTNTSFHPFWLMDIGTNNFSTVVERTFMWTLAESRALVEQTERDWDGRTILSVPQAFRFGNFTRRVFELFIPGFFYRNIEDSLYFRVSDHIFIENEHFRFKNLLFTSKKRLNALNVKICLCSGVADANECVVSQTSRRPIPVNRTMFSTTIGPQISAASTLFLAQWFGAFNLCIVVILNYIA